MNTRSRSRRDARGIVLLLALALFCIPTDAWSASTPTIRAVPNSSTVRIGSTVTVTVKISGARNVGSVPFTLLYDSAILEFVGTTSSEGKFLAKNGARTAFLAQSGPLSRGGGVLVGLSRLDPVQGARGKGTLCHLTFRAISPGTSSLVFNRGAVLDPMSNPLEAVFRETTIRVRPGS